MYLEFSPPSVSYTKKKKKTETKVKLNHGDALWHVIGDS